MRARLAQVQKILEEKQIDLWLLMGRETVDVCDPALRLVFDGNVMGVSAFFFTRTGKRLALVRRQDVSGVEATGCFDQVTGYGDNFDQLLRQTIEDIAPNVIDINADLYDALTDGLTTGLYRAPASRPGGNPLCPASEPWAGDSRRAWQKDPRGNCHAGAGTQAAEPGL